MPDCSAWRLAEGSYHKVTSFNFNSVNQLTQVSLPDGTASSYKYDAGGRRVEKSTGSTSSPAVTRFVYDGQNILAELDGNNNLLALFTQGPGIDQPLIMRKSDGTEYFIHGDALGCVVAHTDTSGAVVERVAYEAYGKPTFVDVRGTPVTSTASLTGNPFAFTGRMWESETGLFDYRYRQVYDPLIGRFEQEDPFGLVDSNLYEYAHSNTLSYTDPLGLRPGITMDTFGRGKRSGRRGGELGHLMYPGIYPIMHPSDFYGRIREIRVLGHELYPGEINRETRHYLGSYQVATEFGPNWARFAGVANEVQGFLWWDIRSLRSRLMGESRWAFSLQDLWVNEMGIADAMLLGGDTDLASGREPCGSQQ